jgi:heme/copper-type cytochrome/quinol oxidase subunit 3
MYAENITVGANLFTSAFFTLTGLHGAHVAVGILALAVLAWMAFAGDVRPTKSTAVEAVSVYWHFVDAVWVVIFSVVYLGSLL